MPTKMSNPLRDGTVPRSRARNAKGSDATITAVTIEVNRHNSRTAK